MLPSLRRGYDSVENIERLLSDLGVPGDKQLNASAELMEAVDEFLRHLPHEIKLTRKELKDVVDALDATLQALQALSPNSLTLFCNEFDGPRGEATRLVDRLRNASECAYKKAREAPNRVPDGARGYLAFRVANILKGLGLTPTITRDIDDNITGARGGAAYARLLRCVLEVAGDPPPDDLRPLMETGLNILRDPRGDAGLEK